MTLKFHGIALALALAVAGCGDNSTTSTAPATTTPAATDNTAAMKAQAEKLLADSGQYIKDHKWELADQGVSQLEAMKPKLPPEYGPKIDQLQSALNAAKATTAPGGIKLP